jgi:plastocyanin
MRNSTPRAVGVAFFLAALAGTALAWPAVGEATQAGAVAAASEPLVRIDNFTFNVALITVKRGTKVTWVNGDDIPHTVVAKDKSFKSTVLDTGDRFSFTFAKAGQYDYFCSLHPHMTGRVIVRG